MLDKMLTGKARRRHAVHRRDRSRACGAAARRRISRRCSSCCICDSRSRAPIRRRSPRWRRRRRRCSRTSWRARTSCSIRPSTPRSAGIIPGGSPETPATVDQWNLDEVAGVLQGALRRREQLHVRVRRQLHARRDQATGRNLHRQPAGHARARDRGATSASRRRPA